MSKITTTSIAIPSWRSKLLASLQIAATLAATIGSVDLIEAVKVIPDIPNWISVWLAIVGTFLRFTAEPIIILIGDIADDGIKNDSFKIKEH